MAQTLLILLNNILNFGKTVHWYHCVLFPQITTIKWIILLCCSSHKVNNIKKRILKISLRQTITWKTNRNCFHMKNIAEESFQRTMLSLIVRCHTFSVNPFVKFGLTKTCKIIPFVHVIRISCSIYRELSTWILRKEWLSCNNILSFLFIFHYLFARLKLFCRNSNKHFACAVYMAFNIHSVTFCLEWCGALFQKIIPFFNKNKKKISEKNMNFLMSINGISERMTKTEFRFEIIAWEISYGACLKTYLNQ